MPTTTTNSPTTPNSAPISPTITTPKSEKNLKTSDKTKKRKFEDDKEEHVESPFLKKQKKEIEKNSMEKKEIPKEKSHKKSKGDTFAGLSFHFFQVGNDLGRLKETIENFGGCVHFNIRKNTSYLVVGTTSNKLLEMLQATFTSTKTVSVSWVYHQVGEEQ